MTCQQSPSCDPARRHGSVMVLALACMAVASAIALSMLRAATTSHRSLRTERHLRQVECLLSAATATTHARLATSSSDAAVTDEVILLEPDSLTGVGSARVTLARDTDASPPVIRVVVEYPLEGPVTIRRSRDLSHPSVVSTAPEEPLP